MSSEPVLSAGTGPDAPTVFGDRLPIAERYAELLVTDGVSHGLLGPREAERIWSRHLLNCAVVADLLPDSARVVDVGSGAGLPGLALACRRADLSIDLVESMVRRTDFLRDCVEKLELGGRVRVVRGRAEDGDVVALVGGADWVTARAVAPLDRLVRWCLPLLRSGGRLLALKGERAEDEVGEHAAEIRRLGGVDIDVIRCGVDVIDEPATVVVVRRR